MTTPVADAAVNPAVSRKITIDFLYLDLNACGRCKGSNANLAAAVSEVLVRPVSMCP